MFRRIIPCCLLAILLSPAYSAEDKLVPIPEDLLIDEHVAEEFGVNQFTAPSIEKIFRDLEKLGELPYDKLSRKLPESAPKQRSLAAVSLGTLVADALLTVQSKQRGDLQPIGRALMEHAEALGADKRMKRHSKSLVELSLAAEWDKLKKELAGTQADVEAELILLRDARIAQLISLGGWLRAFQIAARSIEESYSPEKTKMLLRVDLVDYFVAEMKNLQPEDLPKATVETLRTDLAKFRKRLGERAGDTLSKPDVSALKADATAMLDRLLAAR